MNTEFIQQNENWNAEPNAPNPAVRVDGSNLHLEFSPNNFAFPEYETISKIVLTFHNCCRYRVGTVNDEGWYSGQCRFSKIAPAWGEFYEIRGNLKLEEINDWIEISNLRDCANHYLFYFRDEEFECDADSWSKRNVA